MVVASLLRLWNEKLQPFRVTVLSWTHFPWFRHAKPKQATPSLSAPLTVNGSPLSSPVQVIQKLSTAKSSRLYKRPEPVQARQRQAAGRPAQNNIIRGNHFAQQVPARTCLCSPILPTQSQGLLLPCMGWEPSQTLFTRRHSSKPQPRQAVLGSGVKSETRKLRAGKEPQPDTAELGTWGKPQCLQELGSVKQPGVF